MFCFPLRRVEGAGLAAGRPREALLVLVRPPERVGEACVYKPRVGSRRGASHAATRGT